MGNKLSSRHNAPLSIFGINERRQAQRAQLPGALPKTIEQPASREDQFVPADRTTQRTVATQTNQDAFESSSSIYDSDSDC